MSVPSERTPHLPPVHEPLREDVRFLGDLLGHVLRDQGGDALFRAVESARGAAISRRERNGTMDAVRDLLTGLPASEAAGITQAFSVYFSLTNLAEQVHRIRRRRDYQLEGVPQPGSLEAVASTLARSPDRLRDVLPRTRIMPVFTAHPTEATRRTILKKEQRIARTLVDRIEQTRPTASEAARLAERLRTEVTLIWQTAEQAEQRPTVADEVEHVLFFLTDVVYRVIPAFYEALERALVDAGIGNAHAALPPLRFGSWVGGDMDGNPNVGPDTIRDTLDRQRILILRRYRTDVRALFEHLSQTRDRVAVSPEVDRRNRDYATAHPRFADSVPARYRDMPYRVLLWHAWSRLGAAETGAEGGYERWQEFRDDLVCIDRSLAEHRGEHAGRPLVQRLLARLHTFGFHLATLDVRQDALWHRRMVGELLGVTDFSGLSTEARTRHLEDALETGVANPGDPGIDLARTLEVFGAVTQARETHGEDAVGPFIISMAQGIDDVLAVLVLARAAGIAPPESPVPLDVAPLLETVDDLQHGAATLRKMLSHPRYREHLRSRGDAQMIMLGYSDSSKISGVGASRWALYTTQEALTGVAREHDVDLEFFHGRGGTIARGGSKPRAAILAGPPGSTRGRFRATEQGEIINGKFGLRGIAERTLELTTGAVLEAAVRDPHPVPDFWRRAMDTLSDASRTAWNALVHDDPRFIPYFRAATPIDVIERMAIGSRPASRRSGHGVENLRAIPWVFAWTQSRHTIPGWYGLGTGLTAARDAHGLELLREMAAGWPFFDNLLADASMALAKADFPIAGEYATLADAEVRPLYDELHIAHVETVAAVTEVRADAELLDGEPLLREIIRLRNPYVDPMSLIQVDLLRRWRATERQDPELERALFRTVRGIARGLRNTG